MTLDPWTTARCKMNRLRPLSKISDEVIRLTSRSDFLKLNKGLKTNVKVFILGKTEIKSNKSFKKLYTSGFTCSKKVGNAVLGTKRNVGFVIWCRNASPVRY